jgi:antitoxin component YwqK of YwqJK toxin-antitoxin module
MKNRIILSSLFFVLALIANGQNDKTSFKNIRKFNDYYPNGKLLATGSIKGNILVDTLYTYFKNGEIQTIHIYKGNEYPRIVYYYENLRGMYAKKREGYFIQKNDTTMIENGIWKYYYKTGEVMDSCVFKNGEQIFRVRFNKEGRIIIDQK